MKVRAPEQLPYSYCKRHGVLLQPASEARDDAAPHCVFKGTPRVEVLAEIRRYTRGCVTFARLSDIEFDETLGRFYRSRDRTAARIGETLADTPGLLALSEKVARTHDLLSEQEDAPIIRLLNAMVSEAVSAGASDVHIETYEHRLDIRFRIDGVLTEALSPPVEIARLLVSRVKIMAQLDISEKRIPQDGRMAVQIASDPIDIRVSTLPTNHGERIVLRILEKRNNTLSINHLGASHDLVGRLETLLAKPHGIILVTGPTGSGKTTTLYAALNHLKDGTRNLLTIEDPVEYDLQGIGQTQINTKIDLTFARGLRAILRQDPDVVMIGEIRDKETAEIAIQASMTGHLVLSTLHTNTALGAIARLTDMGIEPFLISSAVVAVAAQRLVRTLCPDCKAPVPDVHEHLSRFANDLQSDVTGVFRAVGCDTCRHTGYKGRSAIFELISLNNELRQAIQDRASELDLEAIAQRTNQTIVNDGLRQILRGTTSLDEVLRVTASAQLD